MANSDKSICVKCGKVIFLRNGHWFHSLIVVGGEDHQPEPVSGEAILCTCGAIGLDSEGKCILCHKPIDAGGASTGEQPPRDYQEILKEKLDWIFEHYAYAGDGPARLNAFFDDVRAARPVSGTAEDVNYLSVVDPLLDSNPSCHVCGAIMVPKHELKRSIGVKYWLCQSCGTTTGCTEPAAGGTEQPRCQECDTPLSFRTHMDHSIAVVCAGCQVELKHWKTLHNYELDVLSEFFPAQPPAGTQPGGTEESAGPTEEAIEIAEAEKRRPVFLRGRRTSPTERIVLKYFARQRKESHHFHGLYQMSELQDEITRNSTLNEIKVTLSLKEIVAFLESAAAPSLTPRCPKCGKDTLEVSPFGETLRLVCLDCFNEWHFAYPMRLTSITQFFSVQEAGQ